MARENAIWGETQNVNDDILESFDFEELEEKLSEQLDEGFAELEFLQEEKEQIGSPDNLGYVMWDVVREQFISQIAEKAGEDFIKANNSLPLDLSDDAHIQTTENFAQGKIASHNTEIDYQKRFDEWQNNFQRNEDGSIKTVKDKRTGENKAVLRTKNTKKDPKGENYNTNYNAREYIDSGRPKGSKTVHKDHTISAAEIIRDAEANAHMSRAEQAAFANSDKNLIDLDSRANESKGDSKMSDWLDSERNGERPGDRFPINEDELRNRDQEARAEYEKQKEKGEQKSIESGKQSQKKEAFRIGGKALRAVAMQLLAELLNEIVHKMVRWFRAAKRTLDALLDSLKKAILSFIGKMKTHLLNAGTTVTYTIIAAINDKVLDTVKKAWMLLKQGWHALKEAVDYIRDPKHKGMPVGRLMLETGKIVIAGLTGVGAILLSETIEKGLSVIPGFAFDIPYFGNLANIIGIFFGAVVAGIIGALAINLIERAIKNSQEEENIKDQITKGNEILNLQHQLQSISEAKLAQDKANIANTITERHHAAADTMKASLENIAYNCREDKSIQNDLDDIDRLLAELREDQA